MNSAPKVDCQQCVRSVLRRLLPFQERRVDIAQVAFEMAQSTLICPSHSSSDRNSPT